jgi:replicative DNA helicase
MNSDLPHQGPVDRRSLANFAVAQAMRELAVANPQMPVGDAAYQIAREAACQLIAYRGAEKAAEALYALADEAVGVRTWTGLRNIEAEMQAIGLALYDAGPRAVLVERLKPYHFSEECHADIWELVLSGATDPVLVKQKMGDHRGFDDLGGLRYLADLVERAGPFRAAEGCAAAIIDAWTRREMHAAGRAMQGAAGNARGSADDILHDCERTLAEIARSSGVKAEAQSAGLSALDMLEAAYGGEFSGQPCGIEPLDHVTGGIRPDDVWIVAGRTSMGKSVVAASLANGFAKQGLGVLFFSLEMPLREVQARLISDLAYEPDRRYGGGNNVRYGDILKGRGDKSERDRARDAAKKLASLPIAVNDIGGLTIDDIRSQTLRQFRAWARAGIKPGACIIDHIGLVKPVHNSGNKVADATDIANELKALAKAVGAPVVALSQINRNTESRNDNRPTTADLRWSGALEEIADMVCLLFRESYYLERSAREEDKDSAFQKQHDLELIVAKNRAGPICTVKAFVDVACNHIRGAA